MIRFFVEKNEWTPTFADYERRWNRLDRPAREASLLLQNRIRDNYYSQGGGSWPPRTRSYPWAPLRKSGFMMSRQLAASAGKVRKISAGVMIDWSDAITATSYSKFHHLGTSQMSKRQTVRIKPEDFSRLRTIFGQYCLVRF